MAIAITLARFGQKKHPFYRIVVKERGTTRDGKFIEIVGTYNPLIENNQIEMKEDRIKHWISVGAAPTRVVSDLMEKAYPGYYKDIVAKRAAKKKAKAEARKARAKSK